MGFLQALATGMRLPITILSPAMVDSDARLRFTSIHRCRTPQTNGISVSNGASTALVNLVKPREGAEAGLRRVFLGGKRGNRADSW